MTQTKPWILVVDDDPDIRELAQLLLIDAGYEVLSARNGVEALALISRHEQPGLLLLDVMMPEMDGLTLLEVLDQRGQLESLPVVLMTAGPFPQAELPVRTMVRKPFSLEELLELPAEFLAWEPHQRAQRRATG